MKLILAPMATLSHEAFRRAVARFGGCDEYFTEMINASSLLNMGPWEKYYLLAGPEPERIVWQLTGSKAEPMAQAAGIVAAQGGIGVDLNMGCSAPQIANTGAGISWMLKPVCETAAMVRGVKTALENAAKDGSTPMRLSVKLRLGAEDYTDEGFFAFCDMLVQEGVQMLTLHPRTKKEKYRTPPRWQYAEALALRYLGRVPVIVNGDIKDRESFAAAREACPHAEGVMCARASAQKPWLFAELCRADAEHRTVLEAKAEPEGAPEATSEAEAAPEADPASLTVDLEETALRFIDDVAECQPPEFYKTRLQRFFAYYCDNVQFAHFFKTNMLNAANAATPDDALTACKKAVSAYFAQCPDERVRTL
ncbi:MAG: tRNA-dihydrouridine synthase family protein [Treponema sp.]|nr:tRNA-dihydrouridine synthase family protein [Treponema sp.]